MRYKEVDAKHILTRSSLPDADYVINPYVGCEFGCSYCYASFMGRTVGESIDAWGSYVYVKRNAVELLESDLAALKDRKATILISSVTDPYQGAEARYRLTRGILEVLAADGYPGEVGILTKSSLVARDIDIIKRLPRPDVGMTITTTDDELGRFLEVRASATGARLDALKRLHDAGLRPYAFVGPLLPHFRHRPELLDELLGRIAGSGVREVYVEQINLKPYIRGRLWERIKMERPEMLAMYEEAGGEAHRREMDAMVGRLLEKHSLRLRLGEVLYHPEWMNRRRDTV